MFRVLIAGIAQEISSFNPVATEYELFSIQRAEEVVEVNRGTSTAIAGAMEVFDSEIDVQFVTTVAAKAVSAGPMSAKCWSTLSTEFIDSLRPYVGKVDAIYLSLHGAMGGETELDPEGWVLEQTRALFGDDMPIVFSLDLHGILTAKMLRFGNGVTSYQTYPHVDLHDTGMRAASLLLKIVAGAKPVVARVRIPAIVRGDELKTDSGCFGDQIRKIKSLEAEGKILSGGFLIGNPFTDVPELCSQAFIVTDDNPSDAEQIALELTAAFWDNREKMQSNLIPLVESVGKASSMAGPIIFTDAADAPSSGSPGDSNSIIAELARTNYPHSVLAPVTDAPAVKKAVAAGVGGRFTAAVGGALDPRFTPLEFDFEVKLISDGNYILESWGAPQFSGITAVVTSGVFTLVLTSLPVSLFDRSLFLGHGLDPKNFHTIVVKSPHCQPQFFDDWAEHNFNVDAPGSTSANLRSLGHSICSRPIFPLDTDVSFKSEVEIFN
ncbi:MAG: M81 family metallopeptidase [Dehalococcoidia bacterium]|nr:M81 family metallopeptidase [Dehalococcoidia bacterium]